LKKTAAFWRTQGQTIPRAISALGMMTQKLCGKESGIRNTGNNIERNVEKKRESAKEALHGDLMFA
jgi:hypothetical protein